MSAPSVGGQSRTTSLLSLRPYSLQEALELSASPGSSGAWSPRLPSWTKSWTARAIAGRGRGSGRRRRSPLRTGTGAGYCSCCLHGRRGPPDTARAWCGSAESTLLLHQAKL